MTDKTLQDLLKLDLSDYAIAPYNVTSDKAPEQKNVLLSEKLRASTIGAQWKTPTIDTLTTLRERTPTAVEDFAWSTATNTIDAIRNIAPAAAIEAITNPTGFALGTAAATVGMKAGAGLGSAVTSAFWKKALGSLGAIVGGTATAGVVGVAADIKAAEAPEFNPAFQQKMLKELEAKYAKDEITDEEYRTTKAQYLEFIRKTEDIFKQNAVNKDEKNEIVDLLEGREYPEGRIVESVLKWGADKIVDRKDLRAMQMEQRGMNPNGIANTAGAIIGNMVPLYASSYIYRNALTRPRFKTIKGVYNVDTGAEKVVQTPTNLTRQQVIDKTEKVAKGITFAQMAGQYETENILDYIERTGDKDLAFYNPSTTQGAMAAAYGAVGTMTEYELGGIEPLIAGSFKKVGIKLPVFKATLKTAGQEVVEEEFQNLEEFLMRNIDDTNKMTWGELLSKMVNSAVWAAPMGGLLGGATFYTARRNLVKGIMTYGQGQINETQAKQIADAIIETAEETVDYKKNGRLEKIRSLVSAMYEDADIPEAEKEDVIDATTALEYSMITQWNTINGTNIDDDPLFKGEVNELGYFRTGIPEDRRADIEAYLAEIRDTQKELENTKEELKNARADEKSTAESITALADKIDELENRIEILRSYEYKLQKIGELEAEDKKIIRAEMARREAQLKELQLAQKIKEKAEREEKKKADEETRAAIREANRAIAQQKAEAEQKRKTLVRHATTEALRNALRGRPQWDDATIERMTRTELRDAVLTIKDIDTSILEQKSVLETAQEQTKKEEKGKTAKKFFHKRINKQFAADSGIREAWGYSAKDPAQNFVFVKEGGIKDWNEIVQALQAEGYMPNTYETTAEATAAQEEIAKDIVLNNRNLDEQAETLAEELDYLAIQGWNILEANGYSQEKLRSMSVQQIREALNKLAPKTTEEDLSYLENVPDLELQSKKRGAYIPFYRFILRANKMDASTLSHELAHDWFEQYISFAQTDKASKEFKKQWAEVEKALQIDPNDRASIKRGSEIFARAYEAWIVNKKDWDKNLALTDPEKDEMTKLFQRYQTHLKDIYKNITNPYFKRAWGKVGELKPELAAWFDKVTETTDIDAQLRQGTITPAQATQRRIENQINKAIEAGSVSEDTKQAVKNVQTLNDTSRYEVEGGNKNAIQNRLAQLARNIDENNMAVNKQYDTRRDMLAVAEAADNFVRTRTDEALDIINGRAPETEGLFATDLYTALERLANETNDLALVEQLSESDIAKRLAKELGQRVVGFRNFLADGRIDTVSALRTLGLKFENALTQKGETQLADAEKTFTEEIKTQDDIATKNVDEFLQELECK